MNNDKNIQDQNQSKDIIQFDEAQAFFELLEIIQEAMESLDITAFEANVDLWQRTYPIEKFSPYFKSRIKYLLSKSYLRTILILPIEIKIQEEFKQDKAYSDLCVIVHRAKIHKDLSRLTQEIDKWKSGYPLDKFNTYYKPRIRRLINPDNFYKITGAFDQKAAFENLESIIEDAKKRKNPDELNKALEIWGQQYNPKDFVDEYSSKVNNLLREDFLSSIIITENNTDNDPLLQANISSSILTADVIKHHIPLNQQSAYFELLNVFKNPKDIVGIFNWTYKYRLIIDKFDDKHKEAIIALISDYYHIPKQSSYQIPDVSQTDWDKIIEQKGYKFEKVPSLNFNNFKEMNILRKEATIQFFAILLNNQTLSNEDHSRLKELYKQSEDSLKVIDILRDEKNDIAEIKDNIDEEELFVVEPSRLFFDENLHEEQNLNKNSSSENCESSFELEIKSTSNSNAETLSIDIINDDEDSVSFEKIIEKDIEDDEAYLVDDEDPTTFFRNLGV